MRSSWAALLVLCLGAYGAHAASLKRVAPLQPQQQGSGGSDKAWQAAQIAVQQGVNRLPAPQTSIVGNLVHTSVFSAVANVLFQGVMVSARENRELGHGEAHCTVFTSLVPLPVPGLYDACIKRYSKVDLCSDSAYYSYARDSAQSDIVPAAARQAWYREAYCGGPHIAEFDVFRKAAGLKPYVPKHR